MTENQFLYNSNIDVYSFGISPVAIDVMLKVKGLNFEESFDQSELIHLEDVNIRYLNLTQLIKAKKSSGRFKDLNDIEHLNKI